MVEAGRHLQHLKSLATPTDDDDGVGRKDGRSWADDDDDDDDDDGDVGRERDVRGRVGQGWPWEEGGKKEDDDDDDDDDKR